MPRTWTKVSNEGLPGRCAGEARTPKNGGERSKRPRAGAALAGSKEAGLTQAWNRGSAGQRCGPRPSRLPARARRAADFPGGGCSCCHLPAAELAAAAESAASSERGARGAEGEGKGRGRGGAREGAREPLGARSVERGAGDRGGPARAPGRWPGAVRAWGAAHSPLARVGGLRTPQRERPGPACLPRARGRFSPWRQDPGRPVAPRARSGARAEPSPSHRSRHIPERRPGAGSLRESDPAAARFCLRNLHLCILRVDSSGQQKQSHVQKADLCKK
ncbi:uncharacterized protein LOC116074483 [Mastomys coucha]|uniref:uncharacterized protein LOC116074483 n=1 Tax=Mastomys coucha TaxID=35658 RepID=UPI0012620C33|nr:uncharacterized protein LOC116074483 [Mastomys coucha]